MSFISRSAYSMDVTLRQLSVFVAVVDHEGFGTAATALDMSQSSVSHTLATLERSLSGEVVRRTTPARPTALGEVLLPHARATLAAARAFDAAATIHHDNDNTEPISLSVPPTAARGLLPSLLRQWNTHLPLLEVTPFEAVDDEIEQWLENGTVDAAILIDPRPAPSGGLHVATDRYEAVVRTDHPLAGEQTIDLADLLEDPLLVTTSGFEAPLRRLHSMAGIPFRPTRRIRELSTLLAMLEAGLGVGVLPSLAASMLPNTLTLVPLRPLLERRLVLTGPATRPWHPSVTALIAASAHRPGHRRPEA